MPVLSAIDRMPLNKRNAAMEKLSRNALRIRSKKTTAAPFGSREGALESLITRLGVIPVFLWPSATAGIGNIHGMPPPGSTVTLTQTDASTPATNVFNKADASAAHTFTVASVKQTITATYSGNANAKGRAAEIV